MYQHSTSRSASRHRSGSRPRNVRMDQFEIVKLINTTISGSLKLRDVRDFLYPDTNPRSNGKLQATWKLLALNKENFVLSDQQKNVEDLTGEETVWVRTVLSLCKTHCRRGKDGRNRACDGDCGALHVCRTFLLRSGNACPFNSNKKRCMFGHSFDTDHNVELLKEHNLYGLHETELQRLFRRRPSRNASTLPQVCIYYNKADGKRCARENCKSLHLCSDFIQHCCVGDCSRNHKLTSPQVSRVLELFAFDGTWTAEMLLDDLRHFMTTRHRTVSGSHSSNEDSDASEYSESGGRFGEHLAGKTTSHPSLDDSNPCPPHFDQSQNCKGCELLKKELNRMQVTVSWLTSQVTDLKKSVDDLKMSNVSSTRPSNQQQDGIGEVGIDNLNPGSNIFSLPVSNSQPNEREPAFRRSQPFSLFSGIPPNSANYEPREVVLNTPD